MKKTTDPEIEFMDEKHVKAVVNIDCLSCSYYDEDLERVVVHPIAFGERPLHDFLELDGTCGLVMFDEDGETIVGYVLWGLDHHEIHVITLTVHPKFRRRGLGTALLEKVYARVLRSKQLHTVVINVHEKDEAAIAFYARHGFKSKVVRNYFRDATPTPDDAGIESCEDAIQFTKKVERPI